MTPPTIVYYQIWLHIWYYAVSCSFCSYLKHILKLCFLRFEISRFGIIVSECHKLILIVIELINFYYELKRFKKESDHKPKKKVSRLKRYSESGQRNKSREYWCYGWWCWWQLDSRFDLEYIQFFFCTNYVVVLSSKYDDTTISERYSKFTEILWRIIWIFFIVQKIVDAFSRKYLNKKKILSF